MQGKLSPKGSALITRHGDIDFERRTALVGVLNVTPDSFSDGGRYLDPENAIARGVKLAEEGADLIDIGGESSRPGARPVSAEEELERVVPVIRGLRRALSVPLSIDTYKARVARVALEEGVDVVNDISAMRFDPEMVRVIAAAKVPVVLMHMQGTPRTMQERPYYRDVVEEVKGFLQERIEFALESGVGPEQILVDPGIGFGKEPDHNPELPPPLPGPLPIAPPARLQESSR